MCAIEKSCAFAVLFYHVHVLLYHSVTRLIKVSKSQKPIGLAGQRFASSSSLGSVDTPSPSPQRTRAIATSTKIAAAQSELQACETHLANKENELALRRTIAVRDGLNVRCQALVQCGWAWTELGKEAIGVLESPELAPDVHGAFYSVIASPASAQQRDVPSFPVSSFHPRTDNT